MCGTVSPKSSSNMTMINILAASVRTLRNSFNASTNTVNLTPMTSMIYSMKLQNLENSAWKPSKLYVMLYSLWTRINAFKWCIRSLSSAVISPTPRGKSRNRRFLWCLQWFRTYCRMFFLKGNSRKSEISRAFFDMFWPLKHAVFRVFTESRKTPIFGRKNAKICWKSRKNWIFSRRKIYKKHFFTRKLELFDRKTVKIANLVELIIFWTKKLWKSMKIQKKPGNFVKNGDFSWKFSKKKFFVRKKLCSKLAEQQFSIFWGFWVPELNSS